MKFQADLATFKIPHRPLLHAEQTTSALEKKYPDLKEWVQAKIKIMKAKKAPGESTGNWILDRRSHYDWHSSMFKNASRDYIRFAQVAYIEDIITAKYRKKMFTKIQSASFIRQELQVLLASHSKPKRVLAGTSQATKIVKEYVFPDGIKITKVEKMAVDVSDLLSTQDSDSVLKKHRQGLVDLVKRIENAPFAVARPDSTLIAQNVSVHLEALKEVRL